MPGVILHYHVQKWQTSASLSQALGGVATEPLRNLASGAAYQGASVLAVPWPAR
jgi:hypothetical protein